MNKYLLTEIKKEAQINAVLEQIAQRRGEKMEEILLYFDENGRNALRQWEGETSKEGNETYYVVHNNTVIELSHGSSVGEHLYMMGIYPSYIIHCIWELDAERWTIFRPTPEEVESYHHQELEKAKEESRRIFG